MSSPTICRVSNHYGSCSMTVQPVRINIGRLTILPEIRNIVPYCFGWKLIAGQKPRLDAGVDLRYSALMRRIMCGARLMEDGILLRQIRILARRNRELNALGMSIHARPQWRQQDGCVFLTGLCASQRAGEKITCNPAVCACSKSYGELHRPKRHEFLDRNVPPLTLTGCA